MELDNVTIKEFLESIVRSFEPPQGQEVLSLFKEFTILLTVLLDLPNTTAIWSSVMVSLASMAFATANSCRLREFIGSF